MRAQALSGELLRKENTFRHTTSKLIIFVFGFGFGFGFDDTSISCLKNKF